jgi:hypothetical protein
VNASPIYRLEMFAVAVVFLGIWSGLMYHASRAKDRPHWLELLFDPFALLLLGIGSAALYAACN